MQDPGPGASKREHLSGSALLLLSLRELEWGWGGGAAVQASLRAQSSAASEDEETRPVRLVGCPTSKYGGEGSSLSSLLKSVLCPLNHSLCLVSPPPRLGLQRQRFVEEARALEWESDRPSSRPDPSLPHSGPFQTCFPHLQNEDNSGPCLWA